MLKILLLTLSLLIVTGCQNISPEAKADKKPQQKEKTQKVVSKPTKKPVVKKQIHKKAPSPKVTKLFQTVPAKDAILVQSGPNKEHCAMCGMNLVKYYKTSHTAKLDGKNIQYCSMHCLTKHINEGAELENPMVVDVTSLKLIPVTEAYYVVGSDVAGTMTKISKYAFKSLADAKAFQKAHGGKILDFYSTWQVAKKDFNK
jgi:hypothetical protein